MDFVRPDACIPPSIFPVSIHQDSLEWFYLTHYSGHACITGHLGHMHVIILSTFNNNSYCHSI